LWTSVVEEGLGLAEESECKLELSWGPAVGVKASNNRSNAGKHRICTLL